MKVCIRKRNQITLPEEIVKELGLSPSDELIVAMRDGHIELIPSMTIPKDEAYLFTPYWQEAIHQAEKELREGDYKVFDDVDDLLDDLDS